MTRKSGPVVIIGVGMAGVATAFALRRRGVRSIVMVEREEQVATHASASPGPWIKFHVSPRRPTEDAEPDRKGKGWVGAVRTSSSFPISALSVLFVVS
jgi:glycine/D-amino acid oxidase-like deaminating enzyme